MTSRPEWLARVASIAAATIDASTDGELAGLDDDQVDSLSDAEYARLQWAKSEVTRRLYEMGARQ